MTVCGIHCLPQGSFAQDSVNWVAAAARRHRGRFNQRVLDDCLAQGRRNCAPIEPPAR
jgi:hypothetical protein